MIAQKYQSGKPIVLKELVDKAMNNKVFHCVHTCNYCGGENRTKKIVVSDGSDIHELETKCQESSCGKEDYWAYGFFESSYEGFDACEKY